MIARFDEQQRESCLADMSNWAHDPARDAIIRSFAFADFLTAFAFMTEVARIADEAEHHPEWSNIYNKVDILLTTHDAGGLSQRDVQLAQAIDTKAHRFFNNPESISHGELWV